MTSLVQRTISEGIVKLERVQVICSACGQQVEAMAANGRVKGYCAVAKQHVDFPIIETQIEKESTESQIRSTAAKKMWESLDYRARQSVARKEQHRSAESQIKRSAVSKKLWQDPEYRVKQVASHTGRHFTVEHRAKISAGIKRYNRAN